MINLKSIFKRKSITRIRRRDIIDPSVLKALRDISKESQRAFYGLKRTQKAMQHLNYTINEVFWKRCEEDFPEARMDNSGDSIDVLCLSEKRKRVVSSYNYCTREWNTRLKITHWCNLPKNP